MSGQTTLYCTRVSFSFVLHFVTSIIFFLCLLAETAIIEIQKVKLLVMRVVKFFLKVICGVLHNSSHWRYYKCISWRSKQHLPSTAIENFRRQAFLERLFFHPTLQLIPVDLAPKNRNKGSRLPCPPAYLSVKASTIGAQLKRSNPTFEFGMRRGAWKTCSLFFMVVHLSLIHISEPTRPY